MSATLRWGMSLPVPVYPEGIRSTRRLSATKIAKQFSDLNLAENVPMDFGESARKEGRFVFECAWGVTNKVGSVYTVLRTKAPESTAELGDQYCMLGPLNEERLKFQVKEFEPKNESIRFAMNCLKENGFKVIYGKWLTDGYPNVVLFDVFSANHMLEQWKHMLFEQCRIKVPSEDSESELGCLFGFLVATFLQKFVKSHSKANSRSLCVAHFHDWRSAIGLILSRVWNVNVSTIFTVHDTVLGRDLVSSGRSSLYVEIDKIDVDTELAVSGIRHRYVIERIATEMAHLFTATSEMTSLEATCFLKRKPDMLTPNGMNVVKIAATHEFQNLHAIAKEKIHDFIRGHFYGHYNFNLEKTIFFFTAGHYEFVNKGGDLFIKALALLNDLLKESLDPRVEGVTVVAFIVYPARTNSFNAESMKGQAVCKQLRETVLKIKHNIASRVFESCYRGELPPNEDFLTDEERVLLKRCILIMKRNTLPPICTHNLVNEDLVSKALSQALLTNKPTDRVKVVFHPDVPSTVSPMLHLDYEEFVRGCHMGIFPSCYEPWGYTPAECTILGVPSVSTNLSGFGCFLQDHVHDPQSYGVHVMDRRSKTLDECAHELALYLFSYLLLNRRQRIIMRNRTERLSELLDWKNLGSFYREARRLALKKTHPEQQVKAEKHPRPVSGTPITDRTASSYEDEDTDTEEQKAFEQIAFEDRAWDNK